MRYPFMMSTTFLRAIHAPGTWPTVLAAVHWLVMIVAAARAVDCNLVYQHAGQEEDRPSVLPSATPSRAPHVVPQNPLELLDLAPNLFHMYVVKTYEQFMRGDDGGQEATDQDLLLHIEESVKGVDREEAALEAKRRQLVDA